MCSLHFYIFGFFLLNTTLLRFDQNPGYIGIDFASFSTSSYVDFYFNFNFILDSNFNYFSNFNLCPLSSLPLQKSNFSKKKYKRAAKRKSCTYSFVESSQHCWSTNGKNHFQLKRTLKRFLFAQDLKYKLQLCVTWSQVSLCLREGGFSKTLL